MRKAVPHLIHFSNGDIWPVFDGPSIPMEVQNTASFQKYDAKDMEVKISQFIRVNVKVTDEESG